MKKTLQQQIHKTVQKLYPKIKLDLAEVEISYPPAEFGDYACNVALKLAGKLKKNPIKIAEKIKQEFLKDAPPSLGLQRDKIEIQKPGFLNFFVSLEYLASQVAEIIERGEDYGKSGFGQGQKVMVEFVSANPTGPIHLGNGRGGPFGDTIANVLDRAGFDVWREYYVNDFGNQIKILGHSVLGDDQAQYQGEYIKTLRKELKGEKDPFQIGQKAATLIVEQFIRKTMEKLGIYFDQYFSEKSLHESGEVAATIKEFQKKDLIYEKEGALWFRATKFGDEKDRVVKKSTGELTYFGTDIAYHKNKFARGFDKVINIWGADHHGDMARVKGAVEVLGHKDKFEILLTQMVRVIKDGREFKMSKRAGTYVALEDLLDEVGRDAIRFFFLMYSQDTHMDFNINLAREKSDKNPVFYVQYAHARICSILRKAKDAPQKDTPPNLNLLKHEKELALIKHLIKFPELIEELAVSLEVHKLTYFAKDLADRFHSFYHECQVLDENNPELTNARLELVKSAQIVLAGVLKTLGIDAPEKM